MPLPRSSPEPALKPPPLANTVVNSAAQQLLDSHGLRTLTRRAHLLLLSSICRRFHAAPTAASRRFQHHRQTDVRNYFLRLFG